MKTTLDKVLEGTWKDWLHTFVVSLMTHNGSQQEWEEHFKLNAQREIDLRVTINGVEIDFESFIKQLEEQHETMIASEARALIESHFGSLTDTLQKMEDNAKLKLSDDVLPSWEKARLT